MVNAFRNERKAQHREYSFFYTLLKAECRLINKENSDKWNSTKMLITLTNQTCCNSTWTNRSPSASMKWYAMHYDKSIKAGVREWSDQRISFIRVKRNCAYETLFLSAKQPTKIWGHDSIIVTVSISPLTWIDHCNCKQQWTTMLTYRLFSDVEKQQRLFSATCTRVWMCMVICKAAMLYIKIISSNSLGRTK